MNFKQPMSLAFLVLCAYSAAILISGCEQKNVFRSGPGENLSEEMVKIMIEKRGFFDSVRNKAASGFANNFQLQNDGLAVLDRASGLLWQQSGSSEAMSLPNAMNYIAQLNEIGYAGYRDWRLPTVEETMSLVEASRQQASALYLSPLFGQKQRWIWTADSYGPTDAWVVNFEGGDCLVSTINRKIYVRAVRSGAAPLSAQNAVR